MGVIAGSVGFGNINVDTRPKAWMGLAWESDSHQMPLAVLTSLMPTEVVIDPEYNWFEQDVELFEILSDGAATASITTLTFKDSSGGGVNNNLRNGSQLKNDRTTEIVLVTADPSANTGAVTVTRAFMDKTVADASVVDGDRWTILGFIDEDNKASPRAISTEASKKTNYIQLMRESIDVGIMMSQADMRTGPEYAKRRRIAYNAFLRRWDRTWVHSEPKSSGGSTADVIRNATGGLMHPISSNTKDFNGTVSESSFDKVLGKLGRYGSRRKMGLCGVDSISVVNTIAKFSGGTVYMEPEAETYGLMINTYRHALLHLQMLYVPALGTSTNYSGTMIVVDTAQLSRLIYKNLDFKLRKGVEEKGVLGIKDEYLMASGLKLVLERHHGLLTEMTSWVP